MRETNFDKKKHFELQIGINTNVILYILIDVEFNDDNILYSTGIVPNFDSGFKGAVYFLCTSELQWRRQDLILSLYDQ